VVSRSYHDFDIAIQDRGDGRYDVRVLDSPSGQARSEFTLPFSDLELENFLLRIGRPRRGVRRLESPEAEAARTFGRQLAEAMFTGDVGVAWHRSKDVADQEGKGLRLRLRLTDAAHLAEVPWEYLVVPNSGDHLVLSTWTPLVRYLDLPRAPRPLTVEPPLRMLAMVSSPNDYPALDTDLEWSKLDESLGPLEDEGMVEVTRLENATLRELQRLLRRKEYHVFHFIGHGGFDEKASDGVLVLEDENGRSRQVTGHELGTILTDARSIRLAVLNSCEGARAGGADPFGGTAPTLVTGGIPAVVAMQFEITDRAAIVFAHELYAAVSDGFPIDAAVGEARRAIFGVGNDTEWATPVLYMRTDDGSLFEFATPPPPPPVDIAASELPPVAEPAQDEVAPVADVAAEPPPEEVASEEDIPAAPPTTADTTAVQEVEETVAEPSKPDRDEAPEPSIVEPPTEPMPIAARLDDPVEAEPEGDTLTDLGEATEVDEELVIDLEAPEPAPEVDHERPAEPPPSIDDPVAPPVSVPSGPDSSQVTVSPMARLAIAGAALVVLLIVAFASGVFSGDDTTTTAVTQETQVTQATTATTIGERSFVSSETVTAVALSGAITVDGDLDADWGDVTTAYLLDQRVYQAGSVEALGTDATGVALVAYDQLGLYVAVAVVDDVYSQPESGTQIWKGDAITVMLSMSAPGDAPADPTSSDFQITMTPAAADGGASHAFFQGSGAPTFTSATTNEPIEIAARPRQPTGDYELEAFIPWGVIGLKGPPTGTITALFTVFDNDGESVQRTIIGNVETANSGLQTPSDWGRLVFED